jgi:hypothetical protein
VYVLSSGPTRWQFGKAEQRAVSLLLCTDGIWNMFFPSRLEDKDDKHAIHLLHYYLNPDTMDENRPDEDLQLWLSEDMDEINANRPATVNFDDITMVLVCDKQIAFNKQPEEYYASPTAEELQLAGVAEKQRLYGHLNSKDMPVLEEDNHVTVATPDS